MIIKMDYEDIGLVGIKTNYNGKVKKHYIRYIVDEYCIDKAIKQTRGNKNIVAFDYVGDYQYLFTIEDKPNIPIIVTKEFNDINELSISFFMKCVPDWVIVSIKTPSDFCDMRIIETLCSEFPNIRFCGGKFLRLPGCRIGCIQKEDLPYKASDPKYFSTEGCACALLTMPYDKVEGVDLLFKSDEEAKEVKKEETKKKIIDSIEDLLNM